MSEKNIELELNEFPEVNEEYAEAINLSTTFLLATEVMDAYGPGFVIIASPIVDATEDGIPVPSEMGVSINANAGITKTTVATILRYLADALDADIQELEVLANE